MKESFGTEWGEQGFMRLQMVENDSGGICAMFKYPFIYPTFVEEAPDVPGPITSLKTDTANTNES